MHTIFYNGEKMNETEQFIYEKYTIDRLSPYQIAPLINISPRTVYYYLQKLGIQEKRTGEIQPGLKFGYLTTIEIVGKSKNKTNIWKCRCDCGKEYKALTCFLKNGRNISCGCIIKSKKGNVKKEDWNGKNHANFKGLHKLSGHFYSSIKSCAKQRHIEFNVTLQNLWDAWERQNGLCAISGIKLILPKTHNGIKTASLDRIDSSKAYTVDNIQWVHKKINLIKSSMSLEELLFFADKISNFVESFNVINPTISRDFFCDFNNNTQRRNIYSELSESDIQKQYIKQNGCCFLSGIPISLSGKDSVDRTGSLDRIDSDKDYTIDNIIFTHKLLNLSRKTMSLEQYKKWMKLIYNNYNLIS